MTFRISLCALPLLTSCASSPSRHVDLAKLAIFRESYSVKDKAEAEKFLKAQRDYLDQLRNPPKAGFIDLPLIPDHCFKEIDPGKISEIDGLLSLVTKVQVDTEGRIGACPYQGVVVWSLFQYCPEKRAVLSYKVPQKYLSQMTEFNLCQL